MSRRSSIASAVVALTTCAASLGAQSSGGRVFRVTTEFVVVDVVATDRSGRFVDDLQAGDFQILEDGKPQRVEFVTLVRQGAVADAGAAGALDQARTTDWTSSSGRGGGLDEAPARVAVVVDLVSTPADAIPRVRDAILAMVDEELPERAEAMLATLWHGVNVVQPFTADRAAFTAAVRALPAPAGAALGITEVIRRSEQMCDAGGLVPGFLQQLITMGREVIADNEKQLAASSDALAALARSMASMPGRKHVVFYSSGYVLNPVGHVIELVAAAFEGCGGDPDYARRQAGQDLAAAGSFDSTVLETMLDRANRSQVSIYTVDPRGLVVTSAQAYQSVSARGTRGGRSQRLLALEATLPQEYLRTVAADTGGRSFLNSNDLTQGLRRAWRDASKYYLIGYVPPSGRKPGRFHRIDVKVGRADLDVRHRRGYYAMTDRDVVTSDVQQALGRPELFEGAGLEVEAAVEGRRLRVTAFLPPRALRFTEAGDVRVADATVHAVLRDDTGRLVNGRPLFGRDVGLKLNALQLERLLESDNVEIPVDVDAPPAGTYRLTVVARDSGGWIAAQTIELTTGP
jgi:VWFA-related protein